MENLLILLIAILPVYIIAIYVYSKDHNKESRNLLTRLFLYGMAACVPAIILEVFVGPLLGDKSQMSGLNLFIYIFIAIALVEEISKWFFVYKIAYHNKEFDHIYDAIVYCVFVSLGFAFLENILYAFMGGITVGLLRAITAVPGHAIDGIIMGEHLGIAKKYNTRKKYSNEVIAKMLSIILPTLAHCIYDYCLYTGNMTYLIVFLIYLLVMYIYSFKTIKRLSNIKSNFVTPFTIKSRGLAKKCPICGYITPKEICPNCNTNLKINNNNNLTQ